MNVLTEYLQLWARDEGCSQATQSRVYGPQITSYIAEWTSVENMIFMIFNHFLNTLLNFEDKDWDW